MKKAKLYMPPVYVAEQQRWLVMNPETGTHKYLTQKQYTETHGVK